MKKTYQLQVICTVTGYSENGGFSGDRLDISETIRVHANDFLELCQTLGRFHELAEKMKEEEKHREGTTG